MFQRLLRLPLHLNAMSSFSNLWNIDSAIARRSSVAQYNKFLRSTLSALRQSPAPPLVHVLIGNEAADADSIISSLSYAFLNHQQHPKMLHVPVLPIPRAELILRSDVAVLLQELGVNTDALIFVDEFSWETYTKVTLTLLDHNALCNKKISQVQSLQVVEIIDHHSDLGQHLLAEKREVAFANGNALVASTCTLVAERMMKLTSHDVHKLLATMLLGVIALDSINFDPSAKKVTSRDVKVAEILETMAFAKRETLFEWLQTEKFNPIHWQAFTLEHCLQVDYKEFTFASTAGHTRNFGISAVLIDLETFVRKADDAAVLCQKLSDYCKKNGIAFLVVMSMFMTPDKENNRHLLFFQEDGDDAKRCVEYLKRDGSLQMKPLALPQLHRDDRVISFCQSNVRASRKQVAPIIQRALDQFGD